MLTSIPEPWRYKMFVAAAADYFFRTHVTAAASALALGAIPIERSKVTRRAGRRGRRAHRRRLVDAHLPRGRPLARRLGPAVPRRRRLPRQPLRRARRARAPRGHRQDPAQGRQAPHPAARARHLRHPAAHRRRTRAPTASPSASSGPSPSWPTRPRPTGGSPASGPPTGTTPSLTGPDAPAWRRAWALGDRSRKRRRQTRPWPKL